MKLALFIFTAFVSLISHAAAQSIDIFGPAGSGQFGKHVAVLPNGNFVVTNPGFDLGAATDAGAAHLYNGATGALISTMTGSRSNDSVGSNGIVVLPDGDFLVRSFGWDLSLSAGNVGALTRCSGVSGCPSNVTPANSLIGSHQGDAIGNTLVILKNGNYVVGSSAWDNGTVENTGAVTLCDKTAGCPLGPVNSATSLVGSKLNDFVGSVIYPLATGNFVVHALNWDNGAATDAGAVTFGSGTSGVTGVVSAANSLVGQRANDNLGRIGVFPLPNGNYVVASPDWDNGTIENGGAATFCSGASGCSGPVVSFNSLIGLTRGDGIGSGGIAVLANGNFVISSPFWSNGGVADAGAVTWASGTTGISGNITQLNSLFGTSTNDQVGRSGVTPLTNGHYVALSGIWNNGSGTPTGATTWGNGETGTTGPVSAANSLLGPVEGDVVQGQNAGVTPLVNGNYVVRSPFWNNGPVIEAGAATFCGGAAPCTGTVSPSNSLVGSTAFDHVSQGGVTALVNGNYVVASPFWDNAGLTEAGAATWGNGSTGTSGVVSPANSLVGASAQDQVAETGITALTNGNYVVITRRWDNRTIADAGAVTWANGGTGIAGEVSTENSLHGTSANQLTGDGGVTALTNGNYTVATPDWNNGTALRAGAVTWGKGTTGITGTISIENSLVGSALNDHVGNFFYDVIALENGNYIVQSPDWDNGGINSAGAITRGNGTIGTKGVITATNSMVGLTDGGGFAMNYVFDSVNNQFVVGHPSDNTVTLYRTAAAAAQLGGRVTDADGSPIFRATITLISGNGERRTAITNSFGFYTFGDIPTGRFYSISASAKRYRFELPQEVFVDGPVPGYDFAARPQ